MLPNSFAQINLPDLGDSASADLSPLAERKLGERVMSEIRWQDPSYLNDPEVEGYLNQLGARLVAASPAAGQDFDFFAVKDSTLNAFALPGGHIGVHTGLILTTESESELASVMSHEISHVTQRHIARMVGQQS
ncbi:MAG: M48 family metalloprotease, partial [Zoogloea sp.]|nr:M48 family metalloprotease [Zoogloea sp.]